MFRSSRVLSRKTMAVIWSSIPATTATFSLLQWDYVISAGFKGARSVLNGNLGGATRKAQLAESGGYTRNDKGKLCIQGYMDLGDLGGAARKTQLAESEGYMLNKHDKLCITGYHKLGNLNKAALIESEGYMLNKHDKLCITGFHKLGELGGAASKAALAESDGYALNDKGKLCIQGYMDLGSSGGVAGAKISAAKALDEHHTHICISALCQRGVSVRWEKGYPVFEHRCYDPQLSGLKGQQPRQKKGLKLTMCKKCHRTAKECKGGAGCRATCNTTNHKLCQHLH